MTSQDYAFLSSSTVKEIVALGGCVTGMVPPHVAEALQAKVTGPVADGASHAGLISLRD